MVADIKNKISKNLDVVGISNTDKKTKHFSTGMKQRLGIARALLSDPNPLALDELINGLDPYDIRAFRQIITQ